MAGCDQSRVEDEVIDNDPVTTMHVFLIGLNIGLFAGLAALLMVAQ